MKKAAIGIDIGGTNIDFGIISIEGELVESWSEPTKLGNKGQTIPTQIIANLDQYIFKTDLIQEFEILGIGLGAPGFIDEDKEVISGAYNLGWTEPIEIRRPLEEAYALPVVLENDAILAAYGEQWVGKGHGLSNMVLVTLGTGVGGGIVINSELVKGAGGSAGEIGHIVVEKDGYPCTCGNRGCLETVASGTGIVRLAEEQYRNYKEKSEYAQQLKEGRRIEVAEIFHHAEQGDSFAQEIVDQYTEYLGRGLSHIGNILNPDKILLGGGVSQAGNVLIEKTTQSFKKYVYPNVRKTTSIELASLTNRAGVIGAGRSIFHKLNLL